MVIPFKSILKKQYKHIFFDLDRTLWDFEQNMQDCLGSIYQRHELSRFIPSSTDFINSYRTHNERLWAAYRRGDIKKVQLRTKRFSITLEEFGCNDWDLAQVIGNEYITESPALTALIPHTKEVLDYLSQKYRLHIITNGFNEVQFKKLKLCGIENYFSCIVTSEMSGAHKPQSKAFEYPVTAANARKKESIMIGDDLEIDILGAKRFGIDQVYFNPTGVEHNKKVTFEIESLKELINIF